MHNRLPWNYLLQSGAIVTQIVHSMGYLLRFAAIMTQIVPPMGLSVAIRGDSDADSTSPGAICCNLLR